jgi:Family of unknown function (DUF6461)
MLERGERYLWADNDFDLAWTVAVIKGTTARDAVGAYSGGEPVEPIGQMEFTRAFVPEDDLGDYVIIQVMPHGQHTVVIENNGWLGTSQEIAQRASSAGGQFFSVYWSPSGDRIVQAINGQLVASFEPLSIGDTGSEGDTHPEWLHDTVFSTEGLHSTMLAVLEEQTGIAFDPQWLRNELPTYRIPGGARLNSRHRKASEG